MTICRTFFISLMGTLILWGAGTGCKKPTPEPTTPASQKNRKQPQAPVTSKASPTGTKTKNTKSQSSTKTEKVAKAKPAPKKVEATSTPSSDSATEIQTFKQAIEGTVNCPRRDGTIVPRYPSKCFKEAWQAKRAAWNPPALAKAAWAVRKAHRAKVTAMLVSLLAHKCDISILAY